MKFGIIGGGFGIYGWLSAISFFNEIKISTLFKYKDRIRNRDDILNIQLLEKKINWFQTEDQLIKNVDTLVIARRPTDQFKIVNYLIDQSWKGNLILEKPIAPTPELTMRLLKRLSDSKINIQAGFILNETNWTKQVREFILKKKPSKILFNWNFYAHHYKNKNLSWKSNPKFGGGALSFYAIHLISWLSSISQWKVISCSPLASRTEDSCVIFELENKTTKVKIKCNSINKSSELFLIKENLKHNQFILKLKNPFDEQYNKKKLTKIDYRVIYLVKIIEKVINNDWLRISLLKKQVKLWSEITKVRKCY